MSDIVIYMFKGTDAMNRSIWELTSPFEQFALASLPVDRKQRMGTEGFVSLSRWFKKMESVFHISGYDRKNQVKFATCTLLDVALTWWNGHLRTLGHDAAYAMTWETFKKKMTDKYCPRALICTKFVSDEKEKVDKYIGGLLDNIHGNVMSARPKTLDEAVELANDLMDQKLCTYLERNQRHYKSDCPELKNQKHGNQAKGTGVHGIVYALGGEETNQDLDDIEDDINA
nr:hypothetical protein [Tanacetum cinerariifolium]